MAIGHTPDMETMDIGERLIRDTRAAERARLLLALRLQRLRRCMEMASVASDQPPLVERVHDVVLLSAEE